MNVILYSINCPNCKILENMLNQKNISFIKINDTDTMINLGIESVPALSVNGKILTYSESRDWINKF